MKLLKISLLCSLIAISSSAFCNLHFENYLYDKMELINEDINKCISSIESELDIQQLYYLFGKKNQLDEVIEVYCLID